MAALVKAHHKLLVQAVIFPFRVVSLRTAQAHDTKEKGVFAHTQNNNSLVRTFSKSLDKRSSSAEDDETAVVVVVVSLLLPPPLCSELSFIILKEGFVWVL